MHEEYYYRSVEGHPCSGYKYLLGVAFLLWLFLSLLFGVHDRVEGKIAHFHRKASVLRNLKSLIIFHKDLSNLSILSRFFIQLLFLLDLVNLLIAYQLIERTASINT